MAKISRCQLCIFSIARLMIYDDLWIGDIKKKLNIKLYRAQLPPCNYNLGPTIKLLGTQPLSHSFYNNRISNKAV